MTPEEIAALKAQAAPAAQGESGYVAWRPIPGDELVGKVVQFDSAPPTAASPNARILVVQPDGSDGPPVSVWVTPARLKDLVESLIAEAKLVVGSSIYLQRVEDQKTKNGRNMHGYQGAASPPTDAQAAADSVPF